MLAGIIVGKFARLLLSNQRSVHLFAGLTQLVF